MYRWIEEGQEKVKYEQKWAVYTTEVNSFIQNLPTSYEGKSLQTPSREEKGPLTIVTITYGDKDLRSEYDGDGEISWWSCSGGVLSYHIRRWVNNTPDAIKAFCSSCMNSYGYEKDEVTVSCNPVAGEPRVMCEATFTPDIEVEEENDPTTGDNWDDPDEEPEDQEETESFNCSSTLDTLTPSAETYLQVKLKVTDPRDIIKIVNGVEAGELVYRKAGDFGGRIKADGWYRTDDTNPNALDDPAYYDNGETTKKNVDDARVLLKNIPDVVVPSLRVTTTTKVTSKNKVTMQSLNNSMGEAGSMSSSISGGGMSMNAPTFTHAWDSEGNQYPIQKTEWLNEGTSFDGSSVRKRSSLTTGKTFYEGTKSTSYRSISTLKGSGYESSASSVNI